MIESGDLGRTLPEQGSRDLIEIARTMNNMSADFQEVLLMFEYLARSTARSAGDLDVVLGECAATEADRKHGSELMAGLDRMQEVIRDFKYYRVRVEEEQIVDTGIGETTVAESNEQMHHDGSRHSSSIGGSDCD